MMALDKEARSKKGLYVSYPPSNQARIRSSYKVSGLVPAFMDMNQLCLSLSLHGATLSLPRVYSEKGQTFHQVKFLCTNDDRRDAIEAFLIKVEAAQVLVLMVEQHELKETGTDRIELYTKNYADHPHNSSVLQLYKDLAYKVKDMSMGLIAGHDLSQENLGHF